MSQIDKIKSIVNTLVIRYCKMSEKKTIFVHKKRSLPTGYYWRDYNGAIPDDALPGGHDMNRRPTYIGQAFLSKVGLITGTIYPGDAGIRVPFAWKAEYSNIGVKILCSSHWGGFAWENAESTSLHTSTTGKHLVVGGCENGGKILNIGRVMHQGQLIVGKILGYQAGNAVMFFVSGNKEVDVLSYQVLVYYNKK